MSETLQSLRSRLTELNSILLNTLAQRRETAAKIQDIKLHKGAKKYDPQREYELFLSMRGELEPLSDLELEAFSLLMQDHAGVGYPQWNRGDHLIHENEGPKLNPLLLLIFRPAKLNLDALKDEFSSEFRKLLSK